MTRIQHGRTSIAFYSAIVALLASTRLVAQRDTAVVEYDHRAGTLRVLVPHGEKTDTLKQLPGKGHAFRFNSRVAVGIRVINTNTGVYKIAATTDSTRAPAVDSLRAFLGRLGPYLPDVALAFAGPMRRGPGGAFANVTSTRVAVADAKNAAEQVIDALARIDSAIYASDGVHGVLGKTLRTVERMRTEDVQRQATLLRDSLGLAAAAKCPSGGDGRQGPPPPRLAGRILAAFADLAPGSVTLRRSLVDSTVFDESPATMGLYRQLVRLAPRADTAQRDYDDVVAMAYRIERLSATVASACSDWRSGALPVSLAAGPTITLKIDPRAELELARAADQPSTSITVTLLPPSSRFEPAIGVGFVYAPQARFATYGTRTAIAGGTEVYEASKKDLRFGYAASLGFTYRPLNWRESTGGVSIWLPELTLGQLGDAKAFGVGSAIAIFNRVKLGAGAIWVRHTELDHQHVGQGIPNANFLQTVDTYGRAKPYLSLSIFDWPPFLSK